MFEPTLSVVFVAMLALLLGFFVAMLALFPMSLLATAVPVANRIRSAGTVCNVIELTRKRRVLHSSAGAVRDRPDVEVHGERRAAFPPDARGRS